MLKECTVCRISKPLDDYYNALASKDGKQYRCKACDGVARKKYYETNEKSKEKRLERGRKHKLKKYNLDAKGYEELLRKQGGVCAICKGHETKSTSYFLSVDHCHVTQKVRGLLCNNCNRGLGMLGDTKEDLRRAYEYLKETH